MNCLLPTTSLTFLLHLSALRVHAMSASLAAQGVRFATAILSTWEVQASIAEQPEPYRTLGRSVHQSTSDVNSC